MFELSKFAYNVRLQRKRLGITQKELAEKLFISPQNVSKWENGISAPDVDNLFNLAKALDVSADMLMGLSATKGGENLYLAIDGGGTKTEFLLFNELSEIVGHTILGASNPNTVGIDGACNVLGNGIDIMSSYPGNIVGVYAGVAGCGNAENRKKVKKHLVSTYPGIGIEIRNDILNVFNTCPEIGDNCIAAICGTGSVVFAKRGDDLFQVGGWGYLFDGAGSGYDIGRDAICAALSESNGLSEKSLVSELVTEKFGGNVAQNINVFYAKGKDYIASFAPCVITAAEENDKTALEIIDKNAARLAQLINFAVEKYSCRNGVILSGGLSRVLGESMKSKLLPKLNIVYSDVAQIIGAAKVCAELYFRNSPSEGFFDKLCAEYNKQIEKE